MTTKDPYTELLDSVREQLVALSAGSKEVVARHIEKMSDENPDVLVQTMQWSDSVFQAVAQLATAKRIIGAIDRAREEGTESDERLVRRLTSYLVMNLISHSGGSVLSNRTARMCRARADVLTMFSMGGFGIERLLGLLE